jgi:hypothetical protein
MKHVSKVPGRRAAKRGGPIDADYKAVGKISRVSRGEGGGDPPRSPLIVRLFQVLYAVMVIVLITHLVGTAHEKLTGEGIAIGLMTFLTHAWINLKHYREVLHGLHSISMAVANVCTIIDVSISRKRLQYRRQLTRFERRLPRLLAKRLARLKTRIVSLFKRNGH